MPAAQISGGAAIRYVDLLERRLHLSVTNLADLGGMPREVTPIGETVFYAGDTQVDGFLSYSGLYAFNAATKARSQILTGDGRPFGDTEFHLKSAGNNLLISEKTGLDAGDSYRLWTVQPGQTRARRLMKDEVPSSLGDLTIRNKRAYFHVGARGGSALYSFEAKTGGGLRREGNGAVFPYINQILSYAGGLAITTYQSLYLLDLANGAVRQAKGLPKATTTFSGAVAGGYLVLNVELPDYQQRVYATLDGTSFTGIAAHVKARTSVASILSPQNSVIWVTSRDSMSGNPKSMTYDLRTGAIKLRATVDSPQFQQVGKSIYMWQYKARPTHDPESVGGYRPPGMITGSSVSIGLRPPTFLHRLDLKGNVVETLAMQDDVFNAPPAGSIESALEGFTSLGGVTYFVGTDYTTWDSSYDQKRIESTLWATDGTKTGTRRIGEIFGTPFVAANRLLYVGSPASRSWSSHLNDDGIVIGKVVIDPDHAKQFGDDLVPLQGRIVYIDMNGDGTIQLGTDPSGITDEQGFYRLEGVCAGKRTVRLGNESGWEATRGWNKTIQVAAGGVRTVSFGLRDTVNNASLTGAVKKGSRGATVFIDLDADFRLDPGEPSDVVHQVGSRDGYELAGLSAGRYHLVLDKYPTDENLPYAFQLFTLAAGQEYVLNL